MSKRFRQFTENVIITMKPFYNHSIYTQINNIYLEKVQ